MQTTVLLAVLISSNTTSDWWQSPARYGLKIISQTYSVGQVDFGAISISNTFHIVEKYIASQERVLSALLCFVTDSCSLIIFIF